MTHLQAVRDALLATPAVVAVLVDRIYPDEAPQGCARPYIVLTEVSAVPHHTHDDAPADLLESVRVQVDCYGTEYAAIHALWKTVDDVLGSATGTTLSASRERKSGGYEKETALYRATADYLVHRVRG